MSSTSPETIKFNALTALESDVRAAAGPIAAATARLGRDGRGSGTVIAKGLILTNAHVLRDRTIAVRFADGSVVSGEVAGVDADGDIAVVRADTGSIEPLTWSDATPAAGMLVIAGHGNGSVALGIVGAPSRSFRGPRGRIVTDGFEHGAALARGASGGPVVGIDGRLIGINTARSDAGYRAVTVSASFVERVQRLIAGEHITRPTLGVSIVPSEAARRVREAAGLNERDGLLIGSVASSSPAAHAGLAKGDLIVAAAGRSTATVDALHAALDDAAAAIELVVVRGAEERTVSVDLTGDRSA